MSVRLQHATTGVTVNVSEETAANLGSEWTSPKAESEEKPARRTSK